MISTEGPEAQRCFWIRARHLKRALKLEAHIHNPFAWAAATRAEQAEKFEQRDAMKARLNRTEQKCRDARSRYLQAALRGA